MKGFLAFTKKEFLEILRNYKLIIFIAIFLLIGMMNPVTAKFTPDILEALMPSDMIINLPEPSALDSWAQFYKNVPQLGLIVLVIMFSGMISNELSKGTLINILTKGLPRRTVVLAKFAAALTIWTAGFFLCFIVSYCYTYYFWPADTVPHLFPSALYLWLFGIFLISALLLGGILFKSTFGSMLFTGGLIVLMFVMNIFPSLQEYNPLALASYNMSLLKGEMAFSDFTWPVILCCGITAGFIFSAISIFNRKEL